MSVQAVARRYASALADVLSEQGDAGKIQRELQAWEEMLQANANLREVFANPTIPLEQKRAVLKRLLEVTKPTTTTANFLKVLLQNQRLTELSAINLKLTQVLDERAGVVAATVTTARAMPDSTRNDLKTTLTKLTGKNVRIDFTTDPNLIGGVVTRIGSTVYDGSVRSQLQEMKEKMAG
jgi:F-type H+-transporting ATPase subunit delta